MPMMRTAFSYLQYSRPTCTRMHIFRAGRDRRYGDCRASLKLSSTVPHYCRVKYNGGAILNAIIMIDARS